MGILCGRDNDFDLDKGYECWTTGNMEKEEIKRMRKNTLERFSTEDLMEELKEREKDAKVIKIDGIFAEYTCPNCGEVSQVDMAFFDDDGIWDGNCEGCDSDITLDLEEN